MERGGRFFFLPVFRLGTLAPYRYIRIGKSFEFCELRKAPQRDPRLAAEQCIPAQLAPQSREARKSHSQHSDLSGGLNVLLDVIDV